jgi:hypothetical protein
MARTKSDADDLRKILSTHKIAGIFFFRVLDCLIDLALQTSGSLQRRRM